LSSQITNQIRVRINHTLPDVAKLYEEIDPMYEQILELESQIKGSFQNNHLDDPIRDKIGELENQIGKLYKKAMDITHQQDPK